MTSIYTKKFNWLPRASAWQSMQSWREKHRAYQEQATATFSSVADTFSSVIVNLGSGMAEIAAKQAATRVNAAVEQKISSIDMSA